MSEIGQAENRQFNMKVTYHTNLCTALERLYEEIYDKKADNVFKVNGKEYDSIRVDLNHQYGQSMSLVFTAANSVPDEYDEEETYDWDSSWSYSSC